MQNTIFSPRNALVLALAIAWSAAASAQALDFAAALRAAQERAPLLQARSATVQGAAALQTSAGQLPDPKFSVGLDGFPVTGPNRGSFTRDDFTLGQIGWMQEVPNRARRTAQTEAALARTEREQALLQAEVLAVRREAGLAWLALHFANRRLALFDELLGHHRVMQDTAAAQLAAGKISPTDVTTIGMEGLALADRRDELQREVAQASALLRRWAGDNASTAGEAPALAVDSNRLLGQLERNPDIAALQPARAMAQAEQREAEAAQSGDWAWSVGYGKRAAAYGDLLSVQFTFTLPIEPALRQQPLINAKRKEAERISAERDEMLRRQTQEIASQLAENTELDNKLQRLRSQTLPLAQQRTAFALAAYEGGRDKLGSVLEARKQHTDLGLRVLELQARQQALLWRLNCIVPE